MEIKQSLVDSKNYQCAEVVFYFIGESNKLNGTINENIK